MFRFIHVVRIFGRRFPCQPVKVCSGRVTLFMFCDLRAGSTRADVIGTLSQSNLRIFGNVDLFLQFRFYLKLQEVLFSSHIPRDFKKANIRDFQIL